MTRIGQGAALVEVLDRGRMRAERRQWAPQVRLTELAVPGIDIAAEEPGVAPFALDRSLNIVGQPENVSWM